MDQSPAPTAGCVCPEPGQLKSAGEHRTEHLHLQIRPAARCRRKAAGAADGGDGAAADEVVKAKTSLLGKFDLKSLLPKKDKAKAPAPANG